MVNDGDLLVYMNQGETSADFVAVTLNAINYFHCGEFGSAHDECQEV